MGTAIRNESTNVSEKREVFSPEKLTQELTSWFEEIKKTQRATQVVFRLMCFKKVTPFLERTPVTTDGKTQEKTRVYDAVRKEINKPADLLKIAKEKKVDIKDLTFADVYQAILEKLQAFFKDAMGITLMGDIFVFDDKDKFLVRKEWTYFTPSKFRV